MKDETTHWKLETLIEMISKLNDKIYINGGSPGQLFRPFQVIADGECVAIEFFSVPVWDNDENQFKTIEEVEADVLEECRNFLKEIGEIRI